MAHYPLSLLEGVMNAQRPDLCIDSRKVTPGCVFVALPGSSSDSPDGALFIQDAVSRGAKYVVCRPEDAVRAEQIGAAVEVIDCVDPRKTLGVLASARFDTRRLPFPVVGVTGTNGKTTVAYLLEHLFASTGQKTGVLGTVAYRWPGHCEDAPLTTPDCIDIHSMLGSMRESGVTAAFMEVSSHALDQNRVAGIRFNGAVFTNLTQDHLDYHGDMERYFQAKSSLFLSPDKTPCRDRVLAVGTDNEWGLRLARQLPEAVGFGLEPHPEGVRRYLHGRILSSSPEGLRLGMMFEGREWELMSPLVGAFNGENLLAVQAYALADTIFFNAHGPEIFRCFETFYGVPGRLERITNPKELDIFVDFAHTPDALENVLLAVRAAGFRRIVTVFGCGGNRDRTKRPRMGEAVARLSDVAVLTSDNPRHEDPQTIMDDVMPGLASAKSVIADPDRRAAIARALAILKPGDALIVAGKGHERTQQIGAVKYPFSDQKIIREILGCA